MSKTHDICYAIPAIKEGDKPRWINCGALIQTQKGLRIKLDSVPVGFNGWFALFEPKPKDEAPKQQRQQGPASRDPDDDIPF